MHTDWQKKEQLLNLKNLSQLRGLRLMIQIIDFQGAALVSCNFSSGWN